MVRFVEKIGKVAKNIDEAASYARRRIEFSGTLVSMMDGGKGRRYAGRWNEKAKTYTVYSYGDHWPMYVWDEQAQQWYGNGTKCWSRTTAKHMNQIRPGSVNCYMPMDSLIVVAEEGAAGWVKNKMEQA